MTQDFKTECFNILGFISSLHDHLLNGFSGEDLRSSGAGDQPCGSEQSLLVQHTQAPKHRKDTCYRGGSEGIARGFQTPTGARSKPLGLQPPVKSVFTSVLLTQVIFLSFFDKV